MAATNGIEYLLTWNCRHLANATLRGKINEACRELGYEPPIADAQRRTEEAGRAGRAILSPKPVSTSKRPETRKAG